MKAEWEKSIEDLCLTSEKGIYKLKKQDSTILRNYSLTC